MMGPFLGCVLVVLHTLPENPIMSCCYLKWCTCKLNLPITLLGILFLAIIFFTYVYPSVKARIVIFSGLFAYLSLYNAVFCYQKIPMLLQQKNWFLFWVFLIPGLWWAFRALYTLLIETVILDLMQASIVQGLTFLIGIGSAITLYMGLAILNSQRLKRELQKALEEEKTLRGIIPICTSCKKIRDDRGYWNQLESYVRAHSEAEFTHSLCPECQAKLYPK